MRDGFPRDTRVKDKRGKKGRVVCNLSAQYFVEWDDGELEYLMKRDKELTKL